MRRLAFAVAAAGVLLLAACSTEPTTVIVEVHVHRSLCVTPTSCQSVPITDANVRVRVNGESAATMTTDEAGFATTPVRRVGLVRVEVSSPFLSQELSMEQLFSGGELEVTFFDPEPVMLAAPES